MNIDDLSEPLKQLVLSVKKKIDEGISSDALHPEDEVYSKWKVDNFQYNKDTGTVASSAHSKDFIKKTWFTASLKLQESVKKSDEYLSVLKQLTTVFGIEKAVHLMEMFVNNLTYHSFPDSKLENINSDTDALVTIFLKDLKEEPIKFGARVELEGIVLQPEKIDIGDGILIRQTKAEDLEKEFSTNTFIHHGFFPHPSAILNIEILGRSSLEIQNKVEQAAAILRLFKVGSVRHISYHMYSESIINPGFGTLRSSDRILSLEKYSVVSEDVPKLKKFWRRMSDSMPKSFYDISINKSDYITIAYDRYTDALFNSVIFERRIADTIMGLEALFFKPTGEREELAYRLRIRISKLLGLMGYDPHEVKKIINDSYAIRSLFLHGGVLDYGKMKKIEAKYKGIKNILLSVLDYLRASIIAMILVQKDKEELIDLIDDSLIDSQKEKTLFSVVSEAKNFIV